MANMRTAYPPTSQAAAPPLQPTTTAPTTATTWTPQNGRSSRQRMVMVQPDRPHQTVRTAFPHGRVGIAAFALKSGKSFGHNKSRDNSGGGLGSPRRQRFRVLSAARETRDGRHGRDLSRASSVDVDRRCERRDGVEAD